VVYSNLFTSPYYKKRLRVCRRYLPEKRITVAAAQPTWQPKNTQPSVATATAKQTDAHQGKAIVIQSPMQQLEQHNAKGNFYVQVGSFVGRPKSSIIYNITRHGYHYKIIKFPKGGQTINKLLIGPYQTRMEAVQVLTKVRATIQKDAFIAEIR
jgi:cell division protein FtsN